LSTALKLCEDVNTGEAGLGPWRAGGRICDAAGTAGAEMDDAVRLGAEKDGIARVGPPALYE
jgi:hypothetical protein